MRVGALEETITVSGETPVVDVQTTQRETVLSADATLLMLGSLDQRKTFAEAFEKKS